MAKKKAKKKRRPRRNPAEDPTRVSAEEFIAALRHTGGIKAEVADNLSVPRSVVEFCLAREGQDWDRARLRYREECDSVADSAHATIKWLIEQRHDPALAARASQWYLEKRIAEFAPKHTLSVEMKNVISIDQLDLPLTVRKHILHAMRKLDREEKKAKKVANHNANGRNGQ